MWANEEVVEFARWLRGHNDGLPPQCRVGVPRPGRLQPVRVAARGAGLLRRARAGP
ncbi:MAG: erythromycin esterase family protein, partial [Pseudonocardiaceae bacterium]